MELFRLSNIHSFLSALATHPKKRLSQNFLIDQNILAKILLAADVKEGDLILEIGPGLGAMTELLLNRGARVIAIEKDLSFIPHLKRLSSPHFKLIRGDALTFPLEEELKNSLRPGEKGKIVANIPYHLTTPLLQRFLPLEPLLSSISLLVQKEVAKRCVAKEGSKEYGSLSLFIRYYSTPSLLFDVSPTCFYPMPKVVSSLIQFRLQKPPAMLDPSHFFKITRSSFQQRRKMIRTSLKPLFPEEMLTKVFSELGLKTTSRPEEFSFEDFMRISRTLLCEEQKEKGSDA
ncbi:MAG: ribosomal RNA small subunit methyltransferase A [Simkania negevensis]|nr:ribosomal RNA small subunit methyltransferase A [Simkania negevensis]